MIRLLISFLALITVFKKCYSQISPNQFSTKIVIRANDSAFFKETNGQYKLWFKYIDEVGEDHTLILQKGVNIIHSKLPLFLIQQDFLRTPFYVCPGDDIEVYNTKYGGLYFKHKTKNERTTELNFFSALADTVGYFIFSTRGNSLEQFTEVLNREREIEKHYASMVNFSTLFFRINKVPKKFKNEVKIILKNFAYQDSLLLFNEYRLMYAQNKLDSIRLTAFRKNLLNEKMDFTKHSNLASAELYNSIAVFNKVYSFPKDSATTIIWYNHIKKEFAGIQESILMRRAVFLVKALYKGNSFISYGNNNKKNNRTVLSLSGSDKLMTTTMNRIVTLKNIIENTSENLIFIDFWASWCKPCREELPFSRNITPLFKNEIKFLYFSMDDDPNNWLRASEKEDMMNNFNFLLLETEKSELKRVLKISTIPRYVLLDKKLNILLDDAPLPSDPKLINVLEAFLTKNKN